MSQIVFVTNSNEGGGERSRAVYGVVERRRRIEDQHLVPAPQGTLDKLLQAIRTLRDASQLYVGDEAGESLALNYVPSRKAREHVLAAAPGEGWDEKILKRHRNAFRSTQGALFHFPVEQGGELEAFITDWSPFPAAAALALHKDHAFVRRLPKQHGDYFTGRFARHPLTGDLLPVWVAQWVKPEFGTGVVIVNPAHSAADLAFARKVGLPVRFGLATAPVTSDPQTWPDPPIVKAGQTIRTGGLDGLEISEAVEKYFERLSEFGFAERYVDRGVGACQVAAIRWSTDGELSVCTQCYGMRKRAAEETNSCPECDGEFAVASIAPGGLLQTLLTIGETGALEILCPAAEVEDALLFARLLFYDLREQALQTQRLYPVAGSEKTKAEAAPELLGLSLLAAAPLNQVAVLKQQVIDQVKLFYERHQELVRSSGEEAPALDTAGHPLRATLARAQEQLLSWKLNEAFATLYAAQKQFSKESPETLAGLLPAYFAPVYVLAGYEHPVWLKLNDAWGVS